LIKILIDADTGIDDSLAILHALKNPDMRVMGISTGCGNTTATQAAENTLRLIALAQPEYDVPVVVGAQQPLMRKWDGPVYHIHGDNGIGNAELAPSKQTLLNEEAEDFIYRIAKENSGELVLITLGRLTNIALTLRKYPDLVRHVKKLVMMGGTVYAPGNVGPNAEANVHGDPEAADEVFLSEIPITLVGLDVTMRTRLNAQHIAHLQQFCREDCRGIAEYLDTAMIFYRNFNRIQDGAVGDCPVHDPLAVLVAAYPDLVVTQKMKARVECSGDYSTGRIVVDQRLHGIEANYVEMCLEVDGVKAVGKLLSVFCHNFYSNSK